jgi:hypothetical protein
MRNRKKFNNSNTRVVNNAITLPYHIFWDGEDIGKEKEIAPGNVIEQYFGETANFRGYISSITVEGSEIEYVEWDGIVYQPINTNRRYKVKGPLSKINFSTSEHDLRLLVIPREGILGTTISVTIITRDYKKFLFDNTN